MNQFLVLAFLFFIGCVLGWGLEVLYRRFSPANRERKWINPGFLTGPYLPLYGFGLCALYLLAGIEGSPLMKEVTLGNKLLLFLLMAVVMTLLEYIAGLIFIKRMKIKLWDYSNEKFNVQGIICLRFSIYWALVYSLDIVTKIRRFAIENQILIRYEELKQEIRQTAEERKEKVRFLFSFRSPVPLKEHLTRYLDLQKAFEIDPKEFIDEIQDSLKEAVEEGKETLRGKTEGFKAAQRQRKKKKQK